MAELPNRQEIYGSDMRKMDRIGMRLDKLIDRVARLEQKFELLDSGSGPGFVEQVIKGKGNNGKKKK